MMSCDSSETSIYSSCLCGPNRSSYGWNPDRNWRLWMECCLYIWIEKAQGFQSCWNRSPLGLATLSDLESNLLAPTPHSAASWIQAEMCILPCIVHQL